MYKVLIIEDEQPIRDSLGEMLEIKGFVTFLAENGKVGLEIINSQKPDLIISDIMMPEMDGFELLSKLRSSKKTELTPIIMLTAKVELESKLKGLELGADDYITKPFEFRELYLKINNLLKSREKLINSSYTQPGKLNLVSQEAVFLKKLHLLLDKNMENPKLQMEFLASQLNMSLSTFTRNVKKATNTSPNQYVNKYRLNRAKEMIQLNYGNLSEIALKTGFGSLSYFSSSYKKHFGINPSEKLT